MMSNSDSKRYRILAVDDEALILDLYKSILTSQRSKNREDSKFEDLQAKLFGGDSIKTPKFSFDVTLCQQGEEAVEAVRTSIERNELFAVAFIDIRMPPGPDGVWTAGQIRALDSDIEIVIATGYSDSDLKSIPLQIPPPEKILFLQKPFRSYEIYQLAISLGMKWSLVKLIQQFNRE